MNHLAVAGSGRRLISPWIVGALTAIPLVFTAGFAVATVAFTIWTPRPDDDLPENANLAFVFYTAVTGTITVLGIAVVVGLVRRRRWGRLLGVSVMLAASGLICLGIGTGLDSNVVGSLVGGGAALAACLATIALIATGR